MAQLELMNAAANVTSQEELDALRLTLSLFFAERAQKAIDKMWDEGIFDQKKLDELRGQPFRPSEENSFPPAQRPDPRRVQRNAKTIKDIEGL